MEENQKTVLEILKAYRENPSEMDLDRALLISITNSLAVIADSLAERSANNEFKK